MLLYRDNCIPPYECPICGMFCEEKKEIDKNVYFWGDIDVRQLYYERDTWERYLNYLDKVGNENTDYLNLYCRAAWTYKDDDKLFTKYIIKAILEINRILLENAYIFNEKTKFYYFQKAEFLRQLGYFVESKSIVNKLEEKN